MIPSFLPLERENLAWQVVEFCLAQRKVFFLAYMDVFGKADQAATLKNLKGCHEHFCAQVTRIKRNRTVVTAGEEVVSTVITVFPTMKLTLIQRTHRQVLRRCVQAFCFRPNQMAPPMKRSSMSYRNNSPRPNNGWIGELWQMSKPCSSQHNAQC